MNENGVTETRHFSEGWILHVLIAATAVIVLVVLLVVQPWSGSIRNIISNVESCRIMMYSIMKDDTGSIESLQKMAYMSPDRIHISAISGVNEQEMIIIGEDFYTSDVRNAGGINAGTAISQSVSTMIPSKEHTVKTLDELTDVVELEIDIIDGIVCRHYQGRMDFVKRVQEQIDNLDPALPQYEAMLEALEAQIEMMREIKSNIEVWVGKDDGFVRQILFEIQLPSEEGEQLYTQNMLMKYYDFHVYIIIEPPLNASGELLPGWYHLPPSVPD